MSSGLADAAARATAIDPTRSVIVQAPAGSGKTGLLTQRFLGLLAGVAEPEEILAITFTRKAAAEMRARVVAALRDAANGVPEASDYEATTRRLAGAALARDRQRGWRLIGQPARLQIMTIDGLCHLIASRAPWSTGLGFQPDLRDDAQPLYAEAARRCLDHLGGRPDWSAPLERALAHLDNDHLRLAGLLEVLLPKRDQWLRAFGNRGGAELVGAIDAALRDIAVERLRELLRRLTPASRGALAELLSLGVTGAAPLAQGWRSGSTLPQFGPDSAGDWRLLFQVLLTANGDFRKGLNATHGIPRGEPQKRAKELLGELADVAGLAPAAAALRDLPAPGQGYDSDVLGAVLDVMRLAAAELSLVFRQHGAIDYTEMTLRALDALGTPQAPEDTALLLDRRLSHLLVDEFQDTSRGQHELLLRLTAGWQVGDGRTLFFVGDPMQSIYRFREAEVAIFHRVRQDGLGSLPVEPVRLSVNFRSDAVLVDAVNRYAGAFFTAAAAVQEQEVVFAPSDPAPAAGETGTCAVHLLASRDGAVAAERVAELLAAPQPEGTTTAVLARTRNQLLPLLRLLRRRDIPHGALDLLPLGHSPLVRDLASLARALAHPADAVAWASVLRAPWCGLELADLHRLIAGHSDTPLPALLLGEGFEAMSAAGRRRAGRLREVIGADPTHRPLALRVVSAWQRLGGAGLARQPAEPSDVREFLAQLERLDEGELVRDPGALERLLTRSWSPGDPGQTAVQCMTMHKAKGLEFDRVILLGLDGLPRGDDRKLLSWTAWVNDSGSDRLLFEPIQETGETRSDLGRLIDTREKALDRAETARLLYVAMTRARHELHLVAGVSWNNHGEVSSPRSDTQLALLWEQLDTSTLEPLPTPADSADGDEEATAAPLWRLTESALRDCEAQTPPKADGMAAPPVEFSWAGELARHRGTLIHQRLCELSRLPEARWADYLDRCAAGGDRTLLLELGVPPQAADREAQDAAAALAAVIQDPRGRWLLSGERREARSEYPLTVWSAQGPSRLVIDRTFVDDEGRRWVVDFKTGVHEGADRAAFLQREKARYREQLERYAAALYRLTGDEVRAGLYFPMLRDWIDWQPAVAAE